MSDKKLPSELVEKMRLEICNVGDWQVQLYSNYCVKIAVDYASEQKEPLLNTIVDLVEDRKRIEQHRDELIEAIREFTTAIESEEITIQENFDNDGWESCGSRLYEKFNKLIKKYEDGKE